MERRRQRADRLQLDSLVVRRWHRRDVDQLDRAVVESLDHLRPWMPWALQEPVGRGRRRAFIRQSRRSWHHGPDFPFGAFLTHGLQHERPRDPGAHHARVHGPRSEERAEEVVASGGLHARIGPGGLEIGYWTHRDHVGRGIATKLAAGLTTLAFTWPGVERIEIHHDEANLASRRVPEKLGFRLVDRRPDPVKAPGEVGVCWIWAVHRGDWHDPFGWSVGGSPT